MTVPARSIDSFEPEDVAELPTDPFNNFAFDDDSRESSVVRRRSSVTPIAAGRRRWEEFIPREEVLLLLEEGRTIDLMARLMEAHQAMPHDLEVLRSLRVLTHYLRERFDIEVG